MAYGPSTRFRSGIGVICPSPQHEARVISCKRSRTTAPLKATATCTRRIVAAWGTSSSNGPRRLVSQHAAMPRRALERQHEEAKTRNPVLRCSLRVASPGGQAAHRSARAPLHRQAIGAGDFLQSRDRIATTTSPSPRRRTQVLFRPASYSRSVTSMPSHHCFASAFASRRASRCFPAKP